MLHIEKNYIIDKHLVRKWTKDKDSIFAASNKNKSYKIIKNEGLSSTIEYEGLIASYIKGLRNSYIPVNKLMLLSVLKILSFIFSLKNWASRFFRRMGFNFRTITKAQANLRDDIKEYLNKFYFIIQNIINENNLLEHRKNISNADETPIFLEMNRQKALNEIIDKEIKVKSFNKTHIRISALLTIFANLKSIKPFVVFKGKAKGFKEKQLNSLPEVKSGYLFVCCQESSWIDEPLRGDILVKYVFKKESSKQKKYIISIDGARTHYSRRNKKFIPRK